MSTEIAPLRKPLRIALIGTGKMGQHHLQAMKRIDGATVVAVADPTANGDAISALVGAPVQVFADTAAMLESARPDVVHIVTPPGTHAALGRLALAAGAHVYIEKPFTPTRADAEALLADADRAGLNVCAGHQCLFERPSLLALAELGTIGSLVHVESVFSFRKVRRNITRVEQAIDILPHAIYPLLAQLRWDGESAPVELKGLDVRPSGDVYALVRIADRTGIVCVTLSGRPIEQYQHLVGTNGWLRADYISGGLTRVVGEGTGPGALLVPFRRGSQTITGAARGLGSMIFGGHGSYPGLPPLFAAFYHSIVDGRPSPVPPSSILDTVDLCERIGVALEDVDSRCRDAGRAGRDHGRARAAGSPGGARRGARDRRRRVSRPRRGRGTAPRRLRGPLARPPRPTVVVSRARYRVRRRRSRAASARRRARRRHRRRPLRRRNGGRQERSRAQFDCRDPPRRRSRGRGWRQGSHPRQQRRRSGARSRPTDLRSDRDGRRPPAARACTSGARPNPSCSPSASPGRPACASG